MNSKLFKYRLRNGLHDFGTTFASGDIEAREIPEPSPSLRFAAAPNKPLRRSIPDQDNSFG